MLIKRLGLFSLFAVLALFALSVFAQTPPSPGTHITVSKNAEDAAMYSTVQAAVNAAQPGQVIEILDLATYREQITIDSTKHGITLRSKYPTDLAKPVILWRDTVNQSPKNYDESIKPGDTPGTSGNFETCGALRIKRAHGVIIDGITVDGGGPAPFAWKEVWNRMDALSHGNAAITLVVAGGAVVRNCELRNAYIGLNVKDRNTGGVFGNPNPADNDNTIPLSGFGKVGNHLIEYNRIHDNSYGVFFESAWDLASTVRYNLIYNNFHNQSVLNFIKNVGDLGSENNNLPACGAMMFKDMVYTPVAIYNNTFYNNMMNLIGHWKVAAPHLLFNNIFGKSSVPVVTNGGQQNGFSNVDFRAMDMSFTYRQHNSVTSAYLKIDGQGQSVYFDYSCTPQQYDTLWVRDITVWNQYPTAEARPQDIFAPGCPTAHAENMVVPGALLSGGTGGFPRDANMRWLEMSKVTVTSSQTPGKSLQLPDLFQSTDPEHPKFLWPDWEHPYVKEFIQNKGWEAAGIRNADGKIADIGAISSNNNIQQPTLVRIKPTGVVLLSGANASATYMLSLESGTMNNPKIKFLRWISPLPPAVNFGGGEKLRVEANAIHDLTPPSTSLSFGPNTLNVPSSTTAEYGFFEVIVEGTGANGEPVVSDVGFLPYRQLDYILDISVMNGSTVVPNPVVNAGEPVTLRVTAYKRGIPTNTKYTTGVSTTPLVVEYGLLDPTAMMYRQINPEPGSPLTNDPNLANDAKTEYSKTYTVYFTKAGDEVITGAGVWDGGTNNYLTFLGNLAVKVKPGTPDKVAFLQPIPKSQLGGATPPTISGTYAVEVQVQDRYGNPVDVAVPVNMVSSLPNIGSVQTPTAQTDTATGVAEFTAIVTGGILGDIFDLYASIGQSGASKASDTASLRVGRAADQLRVFYYETPGTPKHGSEAGDNKGGYWEDDYLEKDEIEELVATRVPVWVKVRNTTGDTIITSKSAFVCVTANKNSIQFFGTETGGTPVYGSYLANVTGGVAQFWITSDEAVEGVSLGVSAKTTADCDGARDNGITDASRSKIKFTKPSGEVGAAFVKGDGNARPNYVEITFGGGGSFDVTVPGAWRRPDSVSLRWPGNCDYGTRDVASSVIDYKSDGVTIGVEFPPDMFPEGYSVPVGDDLGALVKIYGAIEAGSRRSPTALADSIGPLIARPSASPLCGVPATDAPRFTENKNPGVTPDTLRLQITEALPPQLLVGSSLLMSSDANGTGETALTVTSANIVGGKYELALSPATPLVDSSWIKFNPGHPGIVDGSGNPVHADNRRVQIFQEEIAPELKSAWYVTNDTTGKANFAYLIFDKKMMAPAEIAQWFSGGSFEFNWNGVKDTFNITAENAVGSIRLMHGAANEWDTIAIDLKTAFDKVAGMIITSGNMGINVKYAPLKGWPVSGADAHDRANPVLISAVLQRGSIGDAGEELPDTLIITYSESMNDGIKDIPVPVTILSRNDPNGRWTPALRHIDVTTESRVVKYLVETLEGDPRSGDSVKINESAGVSDEIPNVQNNPGNRRVALEVIPGKINWQTKVKNNPFRDFTEVVITPNAKGDTTLYVEAQIRLYDNMGKIVLDETRRTDPSTSNKALVWVWNGRNKDGRYVGTGTYLLRAVCVAKTEAGVSIGSAQKVNKSIGFVRGKSR